MTLTAANLKVSRLFLDEVDSIADALHVSLPCEHCWFVSASMNQRAMGLLPRPPPPREEKDPEATRARATSSSAWRASSEP